ncbi:MAG: hypothetical protein HYW49_05830 [Deltaproteobacteria bacterium]|nr:hypothetical protein [Deltaproteobacteria bacterium]
MRTSEMLKFISKAMVAYGAVGAALMLQFAASWAWASFLAGWTVSFVNFELLKRIGLVLGPLLTTGGRVSRMIYVLAVAKFLFLGLVLAFLVLTTHVQGIPFSLGVLAVLFAGLGLGIKEAIYART